MVSCDLLDVIRLSWAAHQCAATHKVADIDRAWEHLQCAVACRVAAGHQCVLLGDFNARIGCASTDAHHWGRFGDPEGPNTAGKHMQQLLTQMSMYTLTDRCVQVYPLQNYSYITTQGTETVQVCKSVVDYIVATETMYRAQAVGGVQQGGWEIAGSSHRVLWPRLRTARAPGQKKWPHRNHGPGLT
jgi:exonuclease III